MAPYLWINFGTLAFPKNNNCYFELKLFGTLDWNKNFIPWQTPLWYFPGNWQRKQFRKWDLEWPYGRSPTVGIKQHLLEGGSLRNQKQNACWHWILNKKTMEAASISTSSHYQVTQPRTGLANYHLLHSLFIFKKCHIHRCSLSPNFLLMASTLMASTKHFHFSTLGTTAHSYVSDAHVHMFCLSAT